MATSKITLHQNYTMYLPKFSKSVSSASDPLLHIYKEGSQHVFGIKQVTCSPGLKVRQKTEPKKWIMALG